MLENVTTIAIEAVPTEVWKMKAAGYRFVTMTCCDLGDAHDILYHFDKDYARQHLRVKLPRGTALPSVSGIFFPALLTENEMQDLMGVKVSGMLIDFQGRFILAEGAPVAPLNKSVPGIGIEIQTKTATPAEGAAK